MSTTITENLDRIESTLPAIPARIMRLQRTVAGATYDRTAAVVQAVADSTKNFLDTARLSGKTVTGQARAATTDITKTARTGAKTVAGQARAATKDVAKTARTGAKTVAGQVEAQGHRVSVAAERETTELIDSAIEAVEDKPGTGTPYEEWTKAELVERAKEVGIKRSYQMSKPQLIDALRK